ncbi:MAG: response regulator transcription factor [Planctomycetaceae bacterium]|jgi:DNA-binding response OmpR family regulator|nr:response regulator transcription factor [Planctomycetaceae bacterium]
MPPSVLLVEDDRELAEIVRDYLIENGFSVSIEMQGDLAVGRILQERPDLVVLDVNLPGMDGFTVCKSVRDQYQGAIVMLTARIEEIDEVLGLEFGADDYLTKPVRPRVLLARLRTHLRKSPAVNSELEDCLSVGGLSVYPSRRHVELRAVPVELTSAEFDLLHFLAQRAGKVVSRAELYESLAGETYDPQDRSIDLRISRLRRKLGDNQSNPTRIKSVRGTGYLLSIEP